MRITATQQQEIVSLLKNRYGERSRIWLFGSRVDDQKRGGDVDLFVESQHPRIPHATVRYRHEVAQDLEKITGGITVDLLVRYPDEAETPLQALAKKQGILLHACD